MGGLINRLACIAILGGGLLSLPASAADEPEVLTVDRAVQMALANNRTLKITSLHLDATKEGYLAAKTKRYPSLSTYAFGSQLLAPISFTVPAGEFGTYPGIGPIPATTTAITTPSQPTAYLFLRASQPLLNLYRINLYIKGQELQIEQAAQQLRGQRDNVVANVQVAYYKVVQIQDAIEGTEASITQYKELDRITAQYVAEQVALQSANLEVKAKLAQEQLSLLQLQDKLLTAKETLNNLLGRDIDIDFRASAAADLTPVEDDLKASEARALEQHPEIKQAEITVKQADNRLRQTKASYLPDLALSVQYMSPFGVNFVPTNIAGAGLEFSWEPWDWGRRKHDVNEKTIQVEESKQQLDETKSQVLINVNKQFRAVHEAQAAVAVAGANRDATRAKLREVTLQYEQKTALLRDVLQQQAAVDNANSEYGEAVASFWSARAELRKSIGED